MLQVLHPCVQACPRSFLRPSLKRCREFPLILYNLVDGYTMENGWSNIMLPPQVTARGISSYGFCQRVSSVDCRRRLTTKRALYSKQRVGFGGCILHKAHDELVQLSNARLNRSYFVPLAASRHPQQHHDPQNIYGYSLQRRRVKCSEPKSLPA